MFMKVQKENFHLFTDSNIFNEQQQSRIYCDFKQCLEENTFRGSYFFLIQWLCLNG